MILPPIVIIFYHITVVNGAGLTPCDLKTEFVKSAIFETNTCFFTESSLIHKTHTYTWFDAAGNPEADLAKHRFNITRAWSVCDETFPDAHLPRIHSKNEHEFILKNFYLHYLGKTDFTIYDPAQRLLPKEMLGIALDFPGNPTINTDKWRNGEQIIQSVNINIDPASKSDNGTMRYVIMRNNPATGDAQWLMIGAKNESIMRNQFVGVVCQMQRDPVSEMPPFEITKCKDESVKNYESATFSIPFGNSCYFIIPNATKISNIRFGENNKNMNYRFDIKKAAELCKAENAFLPIIESQYENRFVSKLASVFSIFNEKEFDEEKRIALGFTGKHECGKAVYKWHNNGTLMPEVRIWHNRNNTNGFTYLNSQPNEINPSWHNINSDTVTLGHIAVICKKYYEPPVDYLYPQPTSPCDGKKSPKYTKTAAFKHWCFFVVAGATDKANDGRFSPETANGICYNEDGGPLLLDDHSIPTFIKNNFVSTDFTNDTLQGIYLGVQLTSATDRTFTWVGEPESTFQVNDLFANQLLWYQTQFAYEYTYLDWQSGSEWIDYTDTAEYNKDNNGRKKIVGVLCVKPLSFGVSPAVWPAPENKK